jgi:uncharacterized membrane protein YeiH
VIAVGSLTGLGTFERVLDLVGVGAFSISGAALAVRKGFDVVGVVVLGLVTALGGGILRDVLLGLSPPVAFADTWYLITAGAAAVVVMLAYPVLSRLWRPVLVFDAAGLGLFSIVGTIRALDYDWSWPSAALLGVTTAIGGGVIRDVLARDIPMVFGSASGLYAIPATSGAILTALLWDADLDGPLAAILIGVGVGTLRLISVHRGWRAPVARHSLEP